jgi:PIN like domain
VKVLIDHNISPHIARALAALAEPHGHKVEAMVDKFDPATRDVEWLDALRREGGWAFVSNDQRIWRNPQERAAMLAAQVVGFFLEPAWRKRNVTVFEQAGRLIMWWPTLMQQCAIVQPPAAFRVPLNPRSLLRSVPLPRR